MQFEMLGINITRNVCTARYKLVLLASSGPGIALNGEKKISPKPWSRPIDQELQFPGPTNRNEGRSSLPLSQADANILIRKYFRGLGGQDNGGFGDI